jgi:hypothetical protein
VRAVIPDRYSRRRCVATAGLLALTLGVSGCFGSGDDSSSKEKAQNPATTTTDAATTPSTGSKSGKKHTPSGAKSGGSVKPGHPSKGKVRGIPASASPFVGLLSRTVPVAQAAKAHAAAGKWRLAMGERSYSLYSPRNVVSAGGVRAAHGQVDLSPVRARRAPAVKGHKAPRAAADPCAGRRAVYRYRITGSTITFTPVQEACPARAPLAGTWHRGRRG